MTGKSCRGEPDAVADVACPCGRRGSHFEILCGFGLDKKDDNDQVGSERYLEMFGLRDEEDAVMLWNLNMSRLSSSPLYSSRKKALIVEAYLELYALVWYSQPLNETSKSKHHIDKAMRGEINVAILQT